MSKNTLAESKLSGFGRIKMGLGKELQGVCLIVDGALDIVSGIVHLPFDGVNAIIGITPIGKEIDRCVSKVEAELKAAAEEIKTAEFAHTEPIM